jgi:hypothetical protein
MRVAVLLAVAAVAGAQHCNPYFTNPPQYCPGHRPCPNCGSSKCDCNGYQPRRQEWCNPYLSNPPQYCPGGSGCPACGSSRCACPRVEENVSSPVVADGVAPLAAQKENTTALAAKAQTQCTTTTAGQKTINVPHCRGVGCNAQGPECAFCVYDMRACDLAYGHHHCQSVYNARLQQGVIGCDTPLPTEKPLGPKPAGQCTVTTAGQKSVYLPGCHGVGCNAQGPNCAFCVYDMEACAKPYGHQHCQDVWNARANQGVYGCPSADSKGSEAVIV